MPQCALSTALYLVGCNAGYAANGSVLEGIVGTHGALLASIINWRVANMTKQQALSKADELIESDDNLIYDVAWEHGQIVDNVKEMKWFREAVAHSIMDDSV